MEEKNKKNQHLAESAKCMWNGFFDDFDPSLMESFVRQISQTAGMAPPPWLHLGGGADAIVYGRRIGAMDYCVSVPRAEFIARLDREYEVWEQNLIKIVTAARKVLFESDIFTLIPPLQVSRNPRAVIMPMGDSGLEDVSQIPGAETALVETQHLLTGNGLLLQDGPQLTCWRGVPFIHDWSDLRPK